MRKIFNLFTAVALTVCAFGLTACSDDDDDNTCFYSLGVEELSISGSGSDAVVERYILEVEHAYYGVLGMTEGNNFLTIKGDFDTINKEMRSKFDSASLPEPIVWEDGKYSFTMALMGTNSSNKTVVVASKTFSN